MLAILHLQIKPVPVKVSYLGIGKITHLQSHMLHFTVLSCALARQLNSASVCLIWSFHRGDFEGKSSKRYVKTGQIMLNKQIIYVLER